MHFQAIQHGKGKLGLAALLEAFANDQWLVREWPTATSPAMSI